MTQIYYDINGAEGPCQVVLRDLFGRRIRRHALADAHGSWRLDTSALAKGVYIVCLQQGTQIIETAKLIVR